MTSVRVFGGRWRVVVIAVVVALGASACSSEIGLATDETGNATPAPTVTPVPGATSEPTATPAGSGPTVTAAPTAAATATPDVSPTPEPSPTALPTATPRPTPTPPQLAIEVTPYGDLLGVPLGSEAPVALEALTTQLGQPSDDSGWVVGCPLDDPTLENERRVRWGSLSALFHDLPGDGRRFVSWEFELDPTTGAARPNGPGSELVDLPGSASMGSPMLDVAAQVGAPLYYDDVFGWVAVDVEGMALVGLDGFEDGPLDLVGVPFLALCE